METCSFFCPFVYARLGSRYIGPSNEKNSTFRSEISRAKRFVFGYLKLLRVALQEIIDNTLDASPPRFCLNASYAQCRQTYPNHCSRSRCRNSKNLRLQIIKPFVTSKPDAIGFGFSFSNAMIEKKGETMNIESLDAGTSVIVIVQLPASTGT